MVEILGKLKAIVPLTATLFSMAYQPAAPHWGTMKEHIEHNQPGLVAQDLVAGLSGLRLKGGGQGRTEMDVVGTFNPIDFDNAPYIKVGMWARIAMEGISAVQGFVREFFKGLF